MVAAISDNFTLAKQPAGKNDEYTILEMEIAKPSIAQWFSGIIAEECTPAKEIKIKIIDKGSFIEFVLPSGTAQFTEIMVYNTSGDLVWKTQTYNNNIIVWHKQTSLGGKIPEGRYTLHMKQGDMLACGIADIA